jgi:hypothetical protein
MNRTSGFELELIPGDQTSRARVRVVLRKATHGPEGQVFITPDCTSADEIEGYINAMQAELDEVRSQAQRAFRET